MRFFLHLFISIGLCLCVPSVMAKNIIVITNNAHPISNAPNEAKVINLDRAEELIEQLSVNLPNNQEQAANLAKSRLSSASKDIQMALQDVVDAWALGVNKVPAVVVDNQVVYGISDVSKAITLINSYQEQPQ